MTRWVRKSQTAVKARAFILHVYEGSGFEGGSSWWDDICFQEGSFTPPFPATISKISFAENVATIEWAGQEGVFYTLEKSTDLSCWVRVGEAVPGADTLLSADDPGAVETTALYRIVTTTN